MPWISSKLRGWTVHWVTNSCDATFPQSNPKLDHVVGSISMLEIAVEESIRIVAPDLLCHTDIKST